MTYARHQFIEPTQKGIRALVTFNVQNPNKVGLKGVDVGYDLYVSNKHFANGKLTPIDIQPQSSVSFTV